jgi:hypothetical protein
MPAPPVHCKEKKTALKWHLIHKLDYVGGGFVTHSAKQPIRPTTQLFEELGLFWGIYVYMTYPNNEKSHKELPILREHHGAN